MNQFKLAKLKTKILASVVTLLAVGMGITGWITYWVIDNSVSQNAFFTMQKNLEQRFQAIQAFHTNARQAILFAMDCPTFAEYFALPESSLVTDKPDEPILFTDRQNAIRQKLEKIGDTLQDHFPVVETCLIDRHGREHMRLAKHKKAETLDIHEDHLPFFKKSLQLGAEETFTTQLYISPDYQEWVIAYTSPVVMPDQTVPAFFHFEIPLTTFQKIVTRNGTARERYLLLDAAGLILADSASEMPSKQHVYDKENQEFRLSDDFSSVETLSQDPDFIKMVQQIKAGQTSQGYFQYNGDTYYLAFQSLEFLDWRVAVIKAHDHLIEGRFSFDQILAIIIITPLMMILFGAMSAEALARSLTNPIQRLFDATKEVARGNFKLTLQVQGHDETAQLTASFNQMIHDLNASKQGLIRAKQHTEKILDAMQDVFMLLSMEGLIQDVNHTEPLGLPVKEIIGQPVQQFFKQTNFQELMQNKVMRNVPNHLLTGDGRVVPVLLSAALMTDDQGVASGILLI
ncbi:MAG: HAMP domain-containing protein, partial [Magnetococcus sp. YQC-5]